MKPIRLLFLFLSFCPLAVYAQTAEVGGAVQDPSGAVIPKASVEYRNQDTGVRRQSTTNGEGVYHIEGIDPGKYDATVQAKGFKTLTRENIVFQVGDKAQIDFKMQVGDAGQTVTVDGSGLQINTTDGSVGTVIDRNFVENMPLNGRSFQDLILLTPGVVTQSPQSGGTSGLNGEFSVNGQRTDSNVYIVDGTNANTGGYTQGYGTSGTSGALPAATALGTTQSLVSVDDLQEFRVNSSSYSAEYGLSPGGQFQFETRSGTNEPHGVLYDYLRNAALDANNWFNDNTTPTTPKTAEQQNDFGGTLGAPVWIPRLYDGKNRSFFFFSYEGLRLTEPQAALTTYVPSLTLRQSAPSALQPVLNAFPKPTGAALSNGLAPFVGSYSLPSSVDSTSIRFDEQATSRLKLFYRFSDTQSSTESRNRFGLSELDSTSQAIYTHTVGAITQFSPRIANQFHLNYTNSTGSISSRLDDFGNATPVSLLQLQNISNTNTPGATAGFAIRYSGYEAEFAQQHGTQPQESWNANDIATFSFGHQTLKLGVDFRGISSTLVPESPYVLSNYNSMAGVLSNTSLYGLVEVTSISYPAYTNFAAFIQDELRVNDRLNLSVGLRWEVNPPPTSTSGPLPYVAQGNPVDPSNLTLSSAGAKFWNTTYHNLAPRLGMAYRIHDVSGLETIFRAGGGVFFDTGTEGSTQAFGQSVGQAADAEYFGASYPLTPSQVNLQITNPPVAPYSAAAYYFPSRMQLPYTLQWNASLQQSLGKSQALTLSYVGSNARRLLSQQLVLPATGNFSFGGVVVETSGTTSSYNALQVQFQRSLARGLQLLASYSWAHSIDFGSQDLDFTQIRGNSDYDVRNTFSLAATYDISHVVRGPLGILANDWSLDARATARTAFPVILDGGYAFLPNGQVQYQGLDLVPNTPVYLHVAGIPGNREINSAAFALPSGNDYGNAPRNFVRGFGMNQIDLAVRRTFPIHDGLNLQFRAEAFNVLNHPMFGYIYPYYGSTQFGQATMTLNENLNMNPLYQQGGPRSMQMSLRLVF